MVERLCFLVFLAQNLIIDNKEDILTTKYEDIFSNDIKKQISISKVFDKILKLGCKLLNNL